MDIKDLGQLKEMQKRLLKKQCDLDIQKAMVKAFIKKEESKKLTLTDVTQQRELLINFAEKVYRRIYFTWSKKTSEKVVDEYLKGNL